MNRASEWLAAREGAPARGIGERPRNEELPLT